MTPRLIAGRAAVAIAGLVGFIAATAVGVSPAQATPPNIPSASAAATRLASLTVAAESHASSYDRDLFPLWITISGACNTREEVLKRDGTNVVTNSSCAATSGTWYSPYDGATWTAASDVDIDHMVPLSEAWASGAWAWTTAKRQSYANDLGGPELWAVTDNVNQAKGDQDPATWQPSRSAFRCTYARAWIQVKWYYQLTIDTAEKSPPSPACSTPADRWAGHHPDMQDRDDRARSGGPAPACERCREGC